MSLGFQSHPYDNAPRFNGIGLRLGFVVWIQIVKVWIERSSIIWRVDFGGGCGGNDSVKYTDTATGITDHFNVLDSSITWCSASVFFSAFVFLVRAGVGWHLPPMFFFQALEVVV